MKFWKRKLAHNEVINDKITEELKEFSFQCMKVHLVSMEPKPIPTKLSAVITLIGLELLIILLALAVGYHLGHGH